MSSNHALLDCSSKTISLPVCSSNSVSSIGKSCLNTTQTKSHFRDNFEGFLVFFSLQGKVEESIEQIPVVREYPEVFPKEFIGFPLEREVEFSIDLVLGSSPISKAPYRMAPVELAELKKEIEL